MYFFHAAPLSLINGLPMNAKSFKASITADKPPKPRISLAVASVLWKVIRSRQSDYAISIAVENVLLQDTGIQGRWRMAIEVRLLEKGILAAALDFVDGKIASLTEEPLT